MAYSDYANAICHKTQKAAQTMIQARITANSLESMMPTASVFAGIQLGALTTPRVVCLCQNATVSEPWEGNWLADLKIQVIASVNDYDDADDFHELAGQMFAFFFQAHSDVMTRLSNATVKYTTQQVLPRRQSWDIEPGPDGQPTNWISEAEFQVQCCGSVIS
jgi:hypothetical protein